MTDQLLGASADEQLMMTAEPCQIHQRHLPESHINHRHHVWPLGMGGPDIEDNIVVLCPTGHVNVHALLREYVVNRGVVRYSISRRWTRGERDLAKLGWDRSQRKAM